ncbi:MAG: TrkH family potassium uptake protein, partial [Lentisphaeria bacterium]|nr:TrkH family potassium uptake protein [Lentisphaeria bacterium]
MMVIGLAMFSAVLTSWLMDDSTIVVVEMATSAAITFLLPLLLFLAIRHKDRGELISFKEGFLIVTLGWISASVAAAIPFILVADISWVDAFFETMSGFSTTGASVLNNIEELPKGLLFWRAMTHWLGGMGIVVLSLAILPVLGVGGQQLFKAEVPGPVSDQLTPRIADSAKILWGVYVLLTGIESVLLRIAGMPWFDSICHSFATLATGGFSTKQASIEYYHTAAGFSGGIYIDAIITVFMFLAGCNFILHLNALRGKPFNYFKDEEFML